MDAERRDIAMLYRRAGFGARPGQLDDAVALGYEQVVAAICAVPSTGPTDPADDLAPPEFDTESLVAALRSDDEDAKRRARRQQRKESVDLITWWLRRMVTTERPLAEKLTWFWHGHFATSLQKVRVPELMYRQNQMLRNLGGGDFESLAQAVATDAAMLVWLDGNTSRKGQPNENFGRELLELFVLGHGHAGMQPYDEADVSAAARAFTGGRIDRSNGSVTVDRRLHDAGSKTFLGETGAWAGPDIVRIACAHPQSRPFVLSRMWSRFAAPVEHDDPVLREIAGPDGAERTMRSVCEAMFLHERFRSDATRSGLVKQPAEWVVGCYRSLGLDPTDERLLRVLSALGQVPLVPPSVGGWPANEAWLSTGAALARLRLAVPLAAATRDSTVARAPERLRVEAAERLLCVDGWGAATAAALARLSDDPARLLALALVAPEYLQA